MNVELVLLIFFTSSSLTDRVTLAGSPISMSKALLESKESWQEQ